jgi:hypothetical protein
MRHMVNGHVVDIPVESDGSVDSDVLRAAAGVPEERPLIHQTQDGGNSIVNPGEKLHLKPGQYFLDAPPHRRG